MPPTSRPVTTRHFFSPHGPLSKWHPNFEFRPGQLEMALEVEAALNDRKYLIVEAGTGTGKTLAYLVPAILSGLEEVANFEIIRDWEKTTETGDRAEIRRLPESSTVRSKLDARRDISLLACADHCSQTFC